VTHERDTSRVRLRREELGVLLKELADDIGRSAALVSMIEGGFVPKRKTQVSIAAALRTTPEALWPEEYA
jgi:transcriptional regulator with XRE-family HTH domain